MDVPPHIAPDADSFGLIMVIGKPEVLEEITTAGGAAASMVVIRCDFDLGSFGSVLLHKIQPQPPPIPGLRRKRVVLGLLHRHKLQLFQGGPNLVDGLE